MVMVQELQDYAFNIKAWRNRLEGQELLVMTTEMAQRILGCGGRQIALRPPVETHSGRTRQADRR